MIYLASQSPRRSAFLRQMKVPFRVVASRYRERGLRHLAPGELAVRHAVGKARGAVLPKAARYVLGADTVVWCRGRALGKPRTLAEAAGMLRRLSGKKHEVYTGLALWDRRSGVFLTAFSRTEVWIRKLSAASIETYLRKVGPYDKAGAYAIQCRPRIVARLRGSYSNVVGLPRELFRKLLRNLPNT